MCQTSIICVIIWILIKTRWFSFILFLIFLGGLIVLFVYVVRLASNEKFELKLEEISLLSVIRLTVVVIIIFPAFFQKNINNQITNFFDQTIIIFSNQIVILVIIVIVYLLFTLIVAVKVSSKYEGPLRNFI